MDQDKKEDLNVINEAVEKFEKEQAKDELSKPSVVKSTYDSKMAGWIIKSSGGLIKNEDQANYVLVALAVIIFIIAGIVFFIG